MDAAATIKTSLIIKAAETLGLHAVANGSRVRFYMSASDLPEDFIWEAPDHLHVHTFLAGWKKGQAAYREPKHCGWTNYETFTIALDVDNEGLARQTIWHNAARAALAKANGDQAEAAGELSKQLRDHYTGNCETLDSKLARIDLQNGQNKHDEPNLRALRVLGSLAAGALTDRVNWREIATELIENIDQ